MSNPAVYLLAETNIQGKRIQIEDNLGEAIHVHIGEFRVTLTITEFLEAAESILDAADQILRLKNLSLREFDLSALDWDWLSRYREIQKVEHKERTLNSLYTIKRVHNRKEFTQTIPLSESRLVHALCGDRKEMAEFEQINPLHVNNETRLLDMLKRIQEVGYPFDNKYIMVNQYGRIYDGDHRAACLYHLMGGEYAAPVLEITFKNEPTIEECKEQERKRLLTMPEAPKEQKPCAAGKEEEKEKPKVRFHDFIEKLRAFGVEYYVIDYGIFNEEGEKIADRLLVAQESGIDKIRTIAGQAGSREAFKDFALLYGLPSPFAVQLTDTKIIVCDRLYTKSMFQNALLPLDQEVNRHSWSKRRENPSKGFAEGGDCAGLIFAIAHCVFNTGGFREPDIAFIMERRETLGRQEFLHLLKKVFFQYAEKMIDQLIEEKYDQIVEGYLTDTSY